MKTKFINLVNKLKNNKTYLYFSIGIIIMVVLLIIILLLSALSNSKISYEQAEKKIETAAISYYQDNIEYLPKVNEKAILGIATLVETKYLSDLTETLEDNSVICTGHVTVYNNNGNYLYIPYLSCGDNYESSTLYETIVNSNPVVDSGNGLYNYNNDLLFKGDEVNNYIKFDNSLWRIIKMNETYIRLIQTSNDTYTAWDDRYNIEEMGDYGINDFSVSRIKDLLDDTYKNLDEKVKMYILSQNECIGSQDKNSSIIDGSAECSVLYPDQYLTLLQANEYALGSADKNCTSLGSKSCKNYNYFRSITDEFWSITPYQGSTFEVFTINSTVIPDDANSKNNLYLVINIPSDVLYISGNGTKDEPYKIN